MAEPGEFTFRAFVNGKLDLVRAEAVSEVIAADSRMALNLAERQLAGALSSALASIRDRLTAVLAECESHLDFPDEELDWDTDLAESLAAPAEDLAKLLAGARDGMVIRQGVRVVISGLPNAGKSSLLNNILGRDRAIVTSIPGTTRDTLEEAATLGGIPVRLTDTAGLRNSDDEVERIGIERSRREIASAEVELRVLDASTGDLGGFEAHDRAIAVWNKMDMASGKILPELSCPVVRVSALTGENMEELHRVFREMVWGREDWSEPDFAVNSRHAAELECAMQALPEAMTLLAGQRWDLAAIPLRSAVEALGRITGEYADPDILEKIFSRFCIGK
jgi:tRNA modification GTPase